MFRLIHVRVFTDLYDIDLGHIDRKNKYIKQEKTHIQKSPSRKTQPPNTAKNVDRKEDV